MPDARSAEVHAPMARRIRGLRQSLKFRTGHRGAHVRVADEAIQRDAPVRIRAQHTAHALTRLTKAQRCTRVGEDVDLKLVCKHRRKVATYKVVKRLPSRVRKEQVGERWGRLGRRGPDRKRAAGSGSLARARHVTSQCASDGVASTPPAWAAEQILVFMEVVIGALPGAQSGRASRQGKEEMVQGEWAPCARVPRHRRSQHNHARGAAASPV